MKKTVYFILLSAATFLISCASNTTGIDAYTETLYKPSYASGSRSSVLKAGKVRFSKYSIRGKAPRTPKQRSSSSATEKRFRQVSPDRS